MTAHTGGNDFDADFDEAGRNNEPGEWSEESAEPLDDFGEDHAGLPHEEAGLGDESHEGEDEAGEESSAPSQRQASGGKRNFVLYAGGAVLVLVVLGIGYNFFASHHRAVASHGPNTAAAANTAHGMARSPAAAEPSAASAPGGISMATQSESTLDMDDTPAAPVPAAASAVPSVPEQTTPAQTAQTMPLSSSSPPSSSLGAPVSAPGPLKGMPAEGSSQPLSPAVANAEHSGPEPAPALAVTAKPVYPSAIQPVQSAVPSETKGLNTQDQAATAELSNRVADMSVQIAQLTAKLDQMNNAVDADKIKNGSSSGSDSALAGAVADLKKQVAELQNQVAAGHAESTLSEETPAASHRRAAHVRNREKTARHGREHPRQTPVTASATPSSSSPDSSHWVLRSATPGVAWVAASAYSSNLRRVTLGDTLPGIGTVKAVRQDGDHWVVEGSRGTIQ